MRLEITYIRLRGLAYDEVMSSGHTHGAILWMNSRSKKASREFIDTELVDRGVDGLIGDVTLVHALDEGSGEIMLATPLGEMAAVARLSSGTDAVEATGGSAAALSTGELNVGG